MHRVILLSVLFLCSVGVSAKLNCILIPQLFGVYFKHHFIQKTLTPDVKQHTIKQFIKSIDASKTMLLEGDVQTIREKLAKLFDTLEKGQCSQYYAEIQKIALERSEESLAFVKHFFKKPYKLDESVELIIDPEKRSYPKTTEEKNKTLTKMIHFQMLNYMTAKVKQEDAIRQLTHRYELAVKRIKEKTPESWDEQFLESYASALDPHSSYLSRGEMEDFQIQMEVSLEGIGAELSSQDGYTVVEKLVPGGSAERSGKLQPKDKIVAVAPEGKEPENVIDMELPKVVRLIRGPKGTKVTLTILRQSGEAPSTFQVQLQREKIDLKEHAANINYDKRTLPNGKTVTVGIIELPSFYGDGGKGNRSSFTDLKKLLNEAKEKQVAGIVLDLTRNGGGLLEEAVRISGLFINLGAIVGTKDAQGNFKVLEDEESGVVYSGPLVVLISRVSASASEILAGALRDYKRAIIVGGDHTFGKGSVQVVSNLPFDLGGMKVTTGMFFLPGGDSTQHIGVGSNVVLPSVLQTEEIGEKYLDYSLAPQTTKPFLSKKANVSGKDAWTAISPEVLTQLATLSKERVSKSEKFKDIFKAIQDSEKNKGVLKLATLKKQADEEKKKEKKEDKAKVAAKEKENKKEKQEAYLEEAVNIVRDYVSLLSGQTVKS